MAGAIISTPQSCFGRHWSSKADFAVNIKAELGQCQYRPTFNHSLAVHDVWVMDGAALPFPQQEDRGQSTLFNQQAGTCVTHYTSCIILLYKVGHWLLNGGSIMTDPTINLVD